MISGSSRVKRYNFSSLNVGLSDLVALQYVSSSPPRPLTPSIFQVSKSVVSSLERRIIRLSCASIRFFFPPTPSHTIYISGPQVRRIFTRTSDHQT
ncbi:hypothetical protein J6590_002139 [Homalodisca vitripennis]|nr:hypothetical protein J6590_002139 [Homalodisca vitripennis]